jgi:hypothetical protein
MTGYFVVGMITGASIVWAFLLVAWWFSREKK